jgi:hypothetical protein
MPSFQHRARKVQWNCEGTRGGRRRNRLAVLFIASLTGLMPVSAAVGGTVPQRGEAEELWTVPVAALATSVEAWTSRFLGVPISAQPPRIDFLAPNELAELRFGSMAEADAPATLAVVALYEDDLRTIHLPTGWTGATAAEMSVLVHEMVHHLQNDSGKVFDCPAGREAEAFEVQDAWLKQFGTTLSAEFDINTLTRIVLTRCRGF